MFNISTKMQSDSGSVRKAKALIFHLNSAFPSDKKMSCCFTSDSQYLMKRIYNLILLLI
jgi:hypothetical protein